MAKYLLGENSFIHGVFYTAGSTVVFDDDLPAAMCWIPLDDAAKRAVDLANKARAKRGLKLDEMPTVDQLLEKLRKAGYTIEEPTDEDKSVASVESGVEALVVGDGGLPQVKKVRS